MKIEPTDLWPGAFVLTADGAGVTQVLGTFTPLPEVMSLSDPAPLLDADGDPMLDPDGKPIIGYTTVEPPAPASIVLTASLDGAEPLVDEETGKLTLAPGYDPYIRDADGQFASKDAG